MKDKNTLTEAGPEETKLVYEGRLPCVIVSNRRVSRGETVALPTETAKALLAQDPKAWREAKPDSPSSEPSFPETLVTK